MLRFNAFSFGQSYTHHPSHATAASLPWVFPLLSRTSNTETWIFLDPRDPEQVRRISSSSSRGGGGTEARGCQLSHTRSSTHGASAGTHTDLPNTPRHTGDAVKLNNPTSERARANTVDQIGTDEVCRKAPMWMYKHNVTHRHTHKHNVGGGGGGEGECPLSPELLDQHCQTSSLLKCHNVWDLLYHAQTHTSSTQVHTHFFFF